MEEENIRDQMAQMRQRIQQKKGSSKSLKEIFQTAKAQTVAPVTTRTLIATQETEADTRILEVISGYLNVVSASQIELVEKAYPFTTIALFELAKALIDGEFGAGMVIQARGLHESILEWSFLLKALIIRAIGCKTDEALKPRIFIPIIPALQELQSINADIPSGEKEKWLFGKISDHEIFRKINEIIPLVQVTPQEITCFKRIFKRYLNAIVTPSSSSINLMLEKEKSLEKTIKQAFTIKNSNERTKSIGSIVGNLLQSNNVGEAIHIVSSIKAKKEISKPLISLVKQLLNPKRRDIDALIGENRLDEAIEIAGTLKDVDERDKIYQRLISGLGLHRQTDKALEIAQHISDSDVRDFSLSSLVNGLASRLDFEGAIRVVHMITEREYRDDANAYIVKKLLENLSFADAIAFVSNISDPVERSRAAKVILSAVRSTHEQKKIDEVSSLFKLAI